MFGGDEESLNKKPSQEELEQQRQKQEEFKNQILNQILDQQARARLSTLSLAKPDKAQAVENMLISMARMGRLGGKINEAQLIDILGKIGNSEQISQVQKTAVSFSRRGVDSDDDDEYDRIMQDL